MVPRRISLKTGSQIYRCPNCSKTIYETLGYKSKKEQLQDAAAVSLALLIFSGGLLSALYFELDMFFYAGFGLCWVPALWLGAHQQKSRKNLARFTKEEART